MRTILADDHPVVLMGLRTALRGNGERYPVVGEAQNGVELMALLASQPCDLLITDFSMPDASNSEDGLLMLRRLHRQYPKLPILVLTMRDNPALIQSMLKTGVRAIVDKRAVTRELISALHAIEAGRSYLSEYLREQASMQTSKTPRGNVLSAKEIEVLRLFSQGMTVTDIAKRMNRSVSTISQQKREAKRKLGLTSDQQLHDYARTNGLV